MGCDRYTVFGYDGAEWKEGTIKFSEIDDSTSCLCTFPFNYSDKKIDDDTIRSFAYLGAAVAIQHHEHEDFKSLPDSLPDWVVEEINRRFTRR